MQCLVTSQTQHNTHEGVLSNSACSVLISDDLQLPKRGLKPDPSRFWEVGSIARPLPLLCNRNPTSFGTIRALISTHRIRTIFTYDQGSNCQNRGGGSTKVMVSAGERDGLQGGIPQIARQGQNLGRSKLRAKPESRAWSARELRAKLEPRAQPETDWGRGLGRGLGEPLPRNFWKFELETVQSGVHLKQKSISFTVFMFGVFPSLKFCANCKIKMWKQICRRTSLELKRSPFKGP